MLLHFFSNGSVTTGGWEGHYEIVEDVYPASCNDTLIMDSTYGIFSDGSDSSAFPNYSPGLDCYWHIKTPGHNAYKLLFKKLATEQNNDVVSIYSGNSSSSLLIGYYSGFNLPDTININSNEVFIRFNTNNNIQHDGWEIEYFAHNTQIAGCKDTVFLADTTGVITDGSGNLNYLNDLDCYWLLDPPGKKPINFSFSSFRTESNYDYLYAYDGTDTSADLIGTFHGSSIPTGVYSANSGHLFLHFKSDNVIQTEGWELNYTTGDSIPKTVFCKGWVSLTDTNGTLSDGSGPQKYNNNMDCFWQIEPPGAKQVTLSFVALETEKDYDKIDIYDGKTTSSNLLATIDGYTIPSPIVSNTGVMLVNFTSD
ncbi:MAG TPA: hypothetical protein EYQ86_04375, partial [Bacteroidetes bacterium]|nr:hypothetical protein [Bacteroidota bacterium]